MATTSRGIPTGRVPEWTIREQLILASAVQRSGDQNWVSVSRAVKPLVEAVRPPDYFSQKNCALQYSAMLDKASTPKRKRSSDGAPEAVETVEEQIVRQLTEKRLSELHDSLAVTKEEYLTLQKEIELIERGELDDQLPRLWQEIQQEIAGKEDTDSKTKDATILKLKSQPPSNLAKYQEQLKLRKQKSPPPLAQEMAPRTIEAGKPALGTSAEGQEQKGVMGRGMEAVRQLQVHKMEVPPTEPAPATPTQPPSLIIKKETLPGPAEKRVVTSPAPLLAEESPLPKAVTTPKEEPFGLPIRAGQPSTNVSLQQLASDVHIIVHQPNLALVSMAGVATTSMSAPALSVMAITANPTQVTPTAVSVAGAGPMPVSVAGAGPMPVSVAGAGPIPVSVAGAGPMPVSVAGAGPIPVSVAGAGPMPVSVAGAGPTPVSVVGAGPTPVSVAGAGPTPVSVAGAGPMPVSVAGAGPTPVSVAGAGPMPVSATGAGPTPVSVAGAGPTPVSAAGAGPTPVLTAGAGRTVTAAVSSEATPRIATPPATVVLPVTVTSQTPPVQAEKTMQTASMRPLPRAELTTAPRREPASRPATTPATITTPAEVKPSKESEATPTPAQVAPETAITTTLPPSAPREELPQPMETTTTTTTPPTKPEPVKPVPEPSAQAPTVTATTAPSLPASPPPPPTVPTPSAPVPAPSSTPPATTIPPPDTPAGSTLPEPEPATTQSVSLDEKLAQSPPNSEEKDSEVEPERLPSDLKPPMPAEAMEEREVRELPVAAEVTTDQRQELPKKVAEDVETASRERPESLEEVAGSQETTERPMATEVNQEPRPTSQTPEKPPGTEPPSPPAIVVTEAASPKEEEVRSPRSSTSPPSAGGRVTRRSGAKRREAGPARETPQREGSAQEEEKQKTPQPETLPPSEPHSPPSGARRPRPSPSLTPLPGEEGEEDETPIRRGRSSRTPFKKQWITRSRKRRAAEMDELGVISFESADFESEDEPISSQPSTAAPSPAPSQSDMDPELVQAQRQWRKAIMLVWRHAAQHKYANLFLHPVKEDDAPGYTDVIYRPMDLYSIKRNIENGVTKTDIAFQRDMLLIFQNAFMYNSSDHEVYMMAEEMKADVMDSIQDYLATQAQLQLMDDSSGPKLLRSREGRRGDPHEEGVFSPATKKRRTRADD